MALAGELAEQPALAKQLVNTAEREGAIMQLNSTIDRHGAILEQVAKNVAQTNSPLLNRPIRDVKRLLSGSPELKQFQIALNAIEREYGRLSSGAQSKAMLPVNTEKHMSKIFSEDSTLEEIVAEVAQIRVEAQQEEQAMRDTREKIKQSMRSGKIGAAVGGGPPAASTNGSTAPKKRKVYNEATGNFEDR